MAQEIWAAMIGLGVGAPAVWLYNRLVADRNLVRQGYADIDVQLKRRADLVPQLVEAVRGYAAYEKARLASVTERLKKLLLLQESYPQRKADANIETFPDLVVAKLFGFQPMPCFHTDEREPVRVSF